MIWWFKARRIPAVLLPLCAAFAVVLVLAYDWTATLPALASGSSTVRFLTFVPVIVVAALHHCLSQRLDAAEVLSRRPVPRYDVVLVLATVGFTVLAGLAVGALTGDDAARAVGRNVAFLTGLMLLAHRFVPQAAAGVPVGWVFLSVFAGSDAYRRPRFWSVLEHPAAAVPALVEALLCFAAGLAALALARPRTL
ncbi:hypothetical protein SZN_08881 [Streptomyces zinciresistens K42]|uniref:Uncharacterized protein n=1 Tax=Streptomyces zinciresistens K42 TaxID=700597 RepID=G2G8G2_9ACTN|nr:hypothetical protein [Streptomyces zinciresistens]EGX60183.1 hypothetical protein SZN_08881 [Streptomyces zinciresistens K42]